jgi:hypothetical protein
LKLETPPKDLPNLVYYLRKVVVSPFIFFKAGVFTKYAINVHLKQDAKAQTTVYDSYDMKKTSTWSINGSGEIELLIQKDVELTGDIHFEVRNGETKHKDKLGMGWLNMNFVDKTGVEYLAKKDMDKACQDVDSKKTGTYFYVKLVFVMKNENVDTTIEKIFHNVKVIPEFLNF